VLQSTLVTRDRSNRTSSISTRLSVCRIHPSTCAWTPSGLMPPVGTPETVAGIEEAINLPDEDHIERTMGLHATAEQANKKQSRNMMFGIKACSQEKDH